MYANQGRTTGLAGPSALCRVRVCDEHSPVAYTRDRRRRWPGDADAAPADPTDRTFAALIFDWDGTAVPDRGADASDVRDRIEALCAGGVHVFVVSGTHVGNVDGQLKARPEGAGRLHLCLNRGSEVFAVDRDGPALVWRRTATAGEDAALDRAAALTVEAYAELGLEAEIVSQRLNRRKIDIIPAPEWADPPKASIDKLLLAVTRRLQGTGVATLTNAVRIAVTKAFDAGIAAPRVTSDVKHIEIGLTDKTESAQWAAAWLAERGITGGLVLVGGDEFGPLGGVVGSDSKMIVPELARAVVISVGVEPEGVPCGVLHRAGGPEGFNAILDRQLQRLADRRLPAIDPDPTWVVELPLNRSTERAGEALGTLVNGYTGTRAAREEDGVGSVPMFMVNDVYDGSPSPALVRGPDWTALDAPSERRRQSRRLDLRTGVLVRSSEVDSGIRSFRFASMARPTALAMRAENSEWRTTANGVGQPTADSGTDACGIATASRDLTSPNNGGAVLERLTAWSATGDRSARREAALAELERLEQIGFDRLLQDHRAAWARRWADAQIDIEGAPEDELAARFAVFHLLGAAPDRGEAAVAARGLTGPAYSGHVFWDADVFVLPALAAIRPAAARAMLEYRLRRMAAARATAAAEGHAGARFPWESAGDGRDVTPTHGRLANGEAVPILTGGHELHISADVAWATAHYANWVGDGEFLRGRGRELVVDTARYWASRITLDRDGAGHVAGVIGPDEYHELIDDNAFTNVMARANLREAARLAGCTSEAALWRHLADALVDGYDPATQLYEQFAGYFDLEPLLVRDLGRPPIAADVVAGRARIANSQVIKQADVLMLHHLVPHEVAAGSLAPNLDFYLPRTAHGSSLSPGIHAALLARAGRPNEALALFKLAARLDLDDVTGTTAEGLHMATLGSVWQALAFGFLGLRSGDALRVDPMLPAAWDAIAMRFIWRGRRLRVRADRRHVSVTCDRPVPVDIGARRVVCDPPGRVFDLEGVSV